MLEKKSVSVCQCQFVNDDALKAKKHCKGLLLFFPFFHANVEKKLLQCKCFPINFTSSLVKHCIALLCCEFCLSELPIHCENICVRTFKTHTSQISTATVPRYGDTSSNESCNQRIALVKGSQKEPVNESEKMTCTSA